MAAYPTTGPAWRRMIYKALVRVNQRQRVATSDARQCGKDWTGEPQPLLEESPVMLRLTAERCRRSAGELLKIAEACEARELRLISAQRSLAKEES